MHTKGDHYTQQWYHVRIAALEKINQPQQEEKIFLKRFNKGFIDVNYWVITRILTEYGNLLFYLENYT